MGMRAQRAAALKKGALLASAVLSAAAGSAFVASMAMAAPTQNPPGGTGVIVASGTYIGIGAANPATTLEVDSANASPVKIYRTSTNNSNIQFSNSTYSMYAGINPAGQFGIGGSNDLSGAPLIVTSGGLVGIGTTAPGAMFEVNGSGIIDTNLTVNGNYNGTVDAANIGADTFGSGKFEFPSSLGVGMSTLPVVTLDVVGPNGSSANIESSVSNTFDIETGRTAGDQILYMGNDKTNHLSYIQAVNYSTAVDTLLLNARGGNVGIGTSAPATKLEVNGTAQVDSNLTVGGQLLENTVDSATAPGFAWTGNTNTGMFSPTTNTVAFTTAGTERMRVDSTGRVGIGTTAPTFPLMVNGTTSATGYCINGANCISAWPSGFTGSGTTNYIPVLTGATALGNSVIYQSGTSIGINTTGPTQALDVSGNIRTTGNLYINSTAGNGIGFWNTSPTTYGIMMSNTSTYQYGDVNDYYVANFMSGGTGRGFVWSYGTTPSMSLNANSGNLALKGVVKVNGTGSSYVMGSLGVATATPAMTLGVSGNGLITGNLTVGGNYNGSVDAANITADTFGANYGNGNFTFPANLTVGGTLTWGSAGNILSSDGNGAIELGPSNSASAQPYMDWHYGVGSVQDYNMRIQNTGNQVLTFRNASSTVFVLNGSTAGIGGITTPQSALEVKTSVSDTNIPALGTIDSGTALYLHNANTTYGLMGGILSNGNVWLQDQRSDANTTVYNMLLQPNGGTVGIGTTANPGRTLEIDQNSSYAGIRINNTTTTGAEYDMLAASTNAFGFYDVNSSTWRFYMAGANTGIGKTNPAYPLDVNGQTNATGYCINGANCISSWPSITSIPAANITSGTFGAGNYTFPGTLTVNSTLNVAGQLFENAADSAAAPGFSWSGNSNTGIFNAATNVLGFSTGGTERARIDGSGNFGIGMTPSYPLDVNGNARATGFIANRMGMYGTYNSAQVQGIWTIGTGWPISTASNTFGNVYGMTYSYQPGSGQGISGLGHQIDFTSNGTVGAAIGLSGGGYFAGNLTVGGNYNGSVDAANITADTFGANYGNGNFAFPGTLQVAGSLGVSSTLNVSGQLLENAADSASAPGFAWSTDANTGMFNAAADTVGFSTGGTERMRITSSGLVGIGATAPGRTVEIDASTQYAGIRINNTSTSGAEYDILADNANNFGLYDVNSSTWRVYVANGGNVGIGTTAPGSYKLNVSGQTNATGYCINGANCISAWPTSNPGTVTSITAGTGLSGGTITTSGTIAVNYGSTAGTAVQGNNTITITAGTGLTGGGTSAALGTSPTLSLGVAYGSTAGTAVQGNNTITVTAGTGLTGGGTSAALGTSPTLSLAVAYGSSAGTAVQGNQTIKIAAGTGITMTGGTLTLGAGGTATTSINTGAALTWTGAQTFNTATTTHNATTLFPGSGIWNTSGNVGIGITGPNAKLDVAGKILAAEGSATAGGYSFEGDGAWDTGMFSPSDGVLNFYSNGTQSIGIAAGGAITFSQGATFNSAVTVNANLSVGTNKLTAGTIDPVYTIGGTNYATYVPGMTGQKEQTAGTLALAKQQDGTYRATISFAQEPQGSDLWLFSQATALAKSMDGLIVSLTPSFDGNVWYTKNTTAETVTFYASPATASQAKSLEVSYNMTAPRFDSAQWTNIAPADEQNMKGLVVTP